MNLIETAETIFLNHYNMISEQIIPLFAQSFVDFYGTDCRRKIHSVFESLQIVFMVDNVLSSQIQWKKQALIHTIENEVDEMDDYSFLLRRFSLLDQDLKHELLQLGMYSVMEKNKKNEINRKIILLHNVRCNGGCEYDRWMEENLESSGASIQTASVPTIYLKIEKNAQILLQGIVHEINHSLMREALYVDENNKTFFVSGVYENDDMRLFNELINEYITNSVMEILKDKIQFSDYAVDTNFGSWYVDIDRLNGNLMRQIYYLLEKEIKDSIVKGNPLLIKKILNDNAEKVFDVINMIYEETFEKLCLNNSNQWALYRRKKSRASIVENEMKKVDMKEINIRNDYYLEIVKDSYSKYLNSMHEMNRFVDELVAVGNARKVR